MIMAQEGEAGPKVYDGQPIFKQFLGVFAYKWIYGKDPVQCAPPCQCRSSPGRSCGCALRLQPSLQGLQACCSACVVVCPVLHRT